MKRDQPNAISRLRSVASPIGIGIGSGLILCSLTLAVHLWLATYPHFDGMPPTLWWQVWVFGGMFVFGSVPASVACRYRVFTPVVVTVGVYAWALTTSWPSLVAAAQSAGAGLTFLPYDFVRFFWPLVLAGALVGGAIEYGVRHYAVGR